MINILYDVTSEGYDENSRIYYNLEDAKEAERRILNNLWLRNNFMNYNLPLRDGKVVEVLDRGNIIAVCYYLNVPYIDNFGYERRYKWEEFDIADIDQNLRNKLKEEIK